MNIRDLFKKKEPELTLIEKARLAKEAYRKSYYKDLEKAADEALDQIDNLLKQQGFTDQVLIPGKYTQATEQLYKEQGFNVKVTIREGKAYNYIEVWV